MLLGAEREQGSDMSSDLRFLSPALSPAFRMCGPNLGLEMLRWWRVVEGPDVCCSVCLSRAIPCAEAPWETSRKKVGATRGGNLFPLMAEAGVSAWP